MDTAQWLNERNTRFAEYLEKNGVPHPEDISTASKLKVAEMRKKEDVVNDFLAKMQRVKSLKEGAALAMKHDLGESATNLLLSDAKKLEAEATAKARELMPEYFQSEDAQRAYAEKIRNYKNETPHLPAIEVVKIVVDTIEGQFGCEFKTFRKYQRQMVKALCLHHLEYIPTNLADPDLQGIDPRKGVYVCGPSQVGKTTIFEILSKITVKGYQKPFKFRVVTVDELVRFAKEHDEPALIAEYSKGQWLCIDECGHEKIPKVFGNDIDVVPLLIHERFRLGKMTHFASNFQPSDLRYEHHIKKRIMQNCNLINTGNAPAFDKFR